jgi:hypothetical protein
MRDIAIDVGASCRFHLQMVVKRAVKPSVDHQPTHLRRMPGVTNLSMAMITDLHRCTKFNDCNLIPSRLALPSASYSPALDGQSDRTPRIHTAAPARPLCPSRWYAMINAVEVLPSSLISAGHSEAWRERCAVSHFPPQISGLLAI